MKTSQRGLPFWHLRLPISYLDRSDADHCAAAGQEAMRRRLGRRAYLPVSIRLAYEWDPVAIYPPGAEHTRIRV